MSVLNGVFTNYDGEKIKLAAVASVSPQFEASSSTYYNITLTGGYHVSVKESYYPMSSFIAAWEVV